MAPNCGQTSQVQNSPQKSHNEEESQEDRNDEQLAEDEEEEEEECCAEKETLEVTANGSGSIAQLEQCSDVQLGARLHYHAPVVINQHFGSEHHESHTPSASKTKESGKDIYDLFAPNKAEHRSCNIRLWAYAIGLFLANVAITCTVAIIIIANNPENATDLEQKHDFKRFLEFIQSHSPGSARWAVLPAVVKAHELELARWMLQQGASTESVDTDGWTAAHRAAESGSIPMLQLLAEYGADFKVQNTFGDCTIHIAIAEGRVDAVKWLLNEGGVPADLTSKHGSTPLYSAIVYYFRSQVSKVFPEVLQLLLNKGAEVSRLSYGSTALHLAAEKGYLKAVKDLVSAGADLSIADKDGATPLHLAARTGNLEVVKFLIMNGANLAMRDNKGNTPLDVAKDDVAKWFRTVGMMNSTSTTIATTTIGDMKNRSDTTESR